MENFDKKKHWETIYSTKELNEVSWFQPIPATSLALIEELSIDKNAKIIDIGGGDSFLVDFLLEAGYINITVLDISETALEKAKNRLGEKAKLVHWITSDVATYTPAEKYDLWHDRAVFHFLTHEKDIEHYLHGMQVGLNKNGKIIMGTFSESGPLKCSGIEIKQYTETSLTSLLNQFFEKIKCIIVDHKTPFDTVQNFVFCVFNKT
jgi:2-polyprenyl-3-methyl-5-hydroxy-6-metoxy-1,4-benzoquinol methylase